MKYYLDTEFYEYKMLVKNGFFKPFKQVNTIELISIGIVSEDLDELAYGGGKLIERSYYAICKEFDIKEAWNNEWLRKNVLKSIFNELTMLNRDEDKHSWFIYKNFKYLINKYGKTRNQIANEVKEFILQPSVLIMGIDPHSIEPAKKSSIEFYAYYADYDWVVFCWLFGRMIDLPKDFPKYCNDLKQILDEKVRQGFKEDYHWCSNIKQRLQDIKNNPNYPKQDNKHNALDDAKWNKNVHKFLNTL